MMTGVLLKQGGHYCDHTYYRSSDHSTMRSPYLATIPVVNENPPPTGGLQFGPVNTFYMYGSMQRRIGNNTYSFDSYQVWPNEYMDWVKSKILNEWPQNIF